MKKLFGQLELTWKKLILFAVIAGVYTGIMAALPFTKDTSLADETYGEVSFYYEENIECWSVRAEFVKTGDTRLILTDKDGTVHTYSLHVEQSSYRIEEITGDGGGTTP